MKLNRFFLWTFMNMSVATVLAQDRTMTIAEVDSVLTHSNFQLQQAFLDIDVAEGQLVQAKKYENPEIQVMHNVQNPVNRKWLDTGYDGQTDVQISQPIAVGGQRKNKVRQAEAILNATKSAYNAVLNDVRFEARTAFVDLYSVQQKLKVYDTEITSVEKILKAHQEQMEKGNISQMQTFRIAAMLSQLRSQKAEMLLEENSLQKQLQILLTQEDNSLIMAQLDDDDIVSNAVKNLARLQPLASQSDSTEFQSIAKNHPEILKMTYEQESACQALKMEKSEALPHITINGEWDKNGSIGHNFFAFGATVGVPLWNQNQGNIRTAKSQYAQATLSKIQKEKELRASLLTLYRSTTQNLQLVENQNQNLSAELDRLLEAAEQQFLKRNISVIEFVDLYSSYRDTKFQMIDSKAMLAKSNEEINKLVGESL
ncbi:MAG: TolC family protein [Bacteroidales bacterium]|nr:TolC family protein [Bacteroidales bacterium]